MPPRISKNAEIIDDACIQCAIDVMGKSSFNKENSTTFDGMLARGSNFVATAYAETDPERSAVLVYLHELRS